MIGMIGSVGRVALPNTNNPLPELRTAVCGPTGGVDTLGEIGSISRSC
jgi:hypothetical protein